MTSAIVVAGGLLGALIGSFLNVVVHRVPAGRSVVRPASSCGTCGARIRPWHNVPVVSWVALRGRCHDCAARISVRYPLVEAGTAAAFAGVTAWALATGFGGAGLAASAPSAAGIAAVALALIALLYLAAIAIALTLIDLDTRTLPNSIVLPAYPVAAALLSGAALLAHQPGRLLGALAGAAVLFGLYFVMAVAVPGGMGYGDVKLAGVLGLYLGWLGWGPLVVGAFAAFVLGGLFGLALMIVRGATRRTAIPFGPWMLAGAWLGVIAGEELATGYLTLVGLA